MFSICTESVAISTFSTNPNYFSRSDKFQVRLVKFRMLGIRLPVEQVPVVGVSSMERKHSTVM